LRFRLVEAGDDPADDRVDGSADADLLPYLHQSRAGRERRLRSVSLQREREPMRSTTTAPHGHRTTAWRVSVRKQFWQRAVALRPSLVAAATLAVG
jgi:hypothetical protein